MHGLPGPGALRPVRQHDALTFTCQLDGALPCCPWRQVLSIGTPARKAPCRASLRTSRQSTVSITRRVSHRYQLPEPSPPIAAPRVFSRNPKGKITSLAPNFAHNPCNIGHYTAFEICFYFCTVPAEQVDCMVRLIH